MSGDGALRPTRDFLRFLEDGRFMLQRARGSGAYVFPPRVAAPGSGARDLEWVEASGGATVYATTVLRARPPAPDRNIVLVDLDEGPRMLARVEGIAPDAVRIGMRVRARVARDGETPLVVFDPEG